MKTSTAFSRSCRAATGGDRSRASPCCGFPGHVHRPARAQRSSCVIGVTSPVPADAARLRASTLGDHGPGCAATAALSHVGRERRNAGRAAREGALICSSDVMPCAASMVSAWPRSKSAAGRVTIPVREPAPFDLGHAAVPWSRPDSVGVVSDHLNDIAVVADLLLAAIDRLAPCPGTGGADRRRRWRDRRSGHV